jgi:hypothetical protein
MKNVSWLFFVTQHCKIGLTLGRACSDSSIPRVCIGVGISRLDPEGLRFRTRFELSSVSPEIVSLDRLGQLWVAIEKLICQLELQGFTLTSRPISNIAFSSGESLKAAA